VVTMGMLEKDPIEVMVMAEMLRHAKSYV